MSNALPLVPVTDPDIQFNFDRIALAIGDGTLILPTLTQYPGVAGGPTTTSSTYATVTNLTVTKTFRARPVLVAWTIAMSHSVNAANVATQAFVDGAAVSKEYPQQLVTAGANELAVGMAVFTPTAASHTLDIRWKTTSAGTLTGNSDSRVMIVLET